MILLTNSLSQTPQKWELCALCMTFFLFFQTLHTPMALMTPNFFNFNMQCSNCVEVQSRFTFEHTYTKKENVIMFKKNVCLRLYLCVWNKIILKLHMEPILVSHSFIRWCFVNEVYSTVLMHYQLPFLENLFLWTVIPCLGCPLQPGFLTAT